MDQHICVAGGDRLHLVAQPVHHRRGADQYLGQFLPA